jgi:hypothetical protein
MRKKRSLRDGVANGSNLPSHPSLIAFLLPSFGSVECVALTGIGASAFVSFGRGDEGSLDPMPLAVRVFNLRLTNLDFVYLGHGGSPGLPHSGAC